MSSAAQWDEIGEQMLLGATGTEGAPVRVETSAAEAAPSELKRIAVERLAAHRSRRAAEAAREAEVRATIESRRQDSRRGSSKVREAVAARYESSLSYQQFLAFEAERALQAAQAEAEVAARNAAAVAAARAQLMQELDHWNQESGPAAAQPIAPPPVLMEAMAAADRLETAGLAAGLKVQLFQELGPVQVAEHRRQTHTDPHTGAEDGELEHLEQEIEFRLAPEFANRHMETQPIPGNVIAFPRQLVASRKARPRLAEGPLRDDYRPQPQLSIFEVEPEQLAQTPAMTDVTAAPEWQSLQLGAATVAEPALPLHAQIALTLPPEPAHLSLRLMAAMVDFCCLAGAALSLGATVIALCGSRLLGVPLPIAGASAAGLLFALFLLYQGLFFTLNEATPGMRYARIGLCTFGDSYPTRKAMRRRIVAKLLAACPLGLGLLWTALDADGFGWHDRISRMYPREY